MHELECKQRFRSVASLGRVLSTTHLVSGKNMKLERLAVFTVSRRLRIINRKQAHIGTVLADNIINTLNTSSCDYGHRFVSCSYSNKIDSRNPIQKKRSFHLNRFLQLIALEQNNLAKCAGAYNRHSSCSTHLCSQPSQRRCKLVLKNSSFLHCTYSPT